MDLNEPYLAANLSNAQQGGKDYLTSLSIPEEDAPKPPMALEENFYINNSAPDLKGYIAMTPKMGSVLYRPDSPTIEKNLDSSPKQKKNMKKKPELPEEFPMLMNLNNQNGLSINIDSDEEPQNNFKESIFNDRPEIDSNKQRRENEDEEAEYKNVFNSSDNNYVNVPAANKSIVNPSYTSINIAKQNERH